MSKEVFFQDKAREGLLRGINLISNAVKATLGPRGRNVVYGFHYGSPIATKDGVTVARQIESSDQLEQMGILLIRQVSQKTADDSGDGTSTAAVLAQAIFAEGLKSLNTGANPILIKRGIDKAVEEVMTFIDSLSKKIDGPEAILNIASLSANNDKEIGQLIVDAITKVGENGVVTIEDNYVGSDSEVITVEGMQLNEGMLHPFFITDTERLCAEYTDPKILIIDGEIVDIMAFKPIIEDCIAKNKRALLIIAHNITGTALQSLAMSKAQGGIPLLACKAPQFGEYRSDMLTDIAILTGSTIVGGKLGIHPKDMTFEQLGDCEKVYSDRFSTTIIGGKGKKEDIDVRVKQIQHQIDVAHSDYEKIKGQERLAKLTSGVAVIKVGGQTEVEQKEKKMRVEDSLHATRAAIEGGIGAGGGVIYLRASKMLEERLNEKSL